MLFGITEILHEWDAPINLGIGDTGRLEYDLLSEQGKVASCLEKSVDLRNALRGLQSD